MTITGIAFGDQTPSDQSQNLPVIVVTAEKITERLEEVPMAITVVSAESMEQNQYLSLADYYGTVPGLSITQNGQGGQTLVAIRGLNTATSGSVSNTTVGITIDDVPVGASNQAIVQGANFTPQLDPAELDHIEVLKGPQGTLYGASSIGGVIRYVTAVPNLDSFSGRIEVDGSTVHDGGQGYGIRASANLPLVNDVLALRIGAFDRDDPGYIKNLQTGETNVNTQEVRGARLDLLWQMNSNLSLRLGALFQTIDGFGDGTLDLNQLLQPGQPSQVRIPGTGAYDNDNGVYSAVLKYSSKYFELTSISAYSTFKYRIDQDLSGVTFWSNEANGLFPPATGATQIYTIDNKKISEEIRIASPRGTRFQWQVGGFFTDENNGPEGADFYANDSQTGRRVGDMYTVDWHPKYGELAAFANIDYQFTQAFDLNLGFRESHNHQSYWQINSGPLQGPTLVVTQGSDDNSSNYLAAARYRVTDKTMAYARFSTGYQPGGPNSPPGLGFVIPATFAPAKSTDYELGIKTSLLNDRLSVDADYFYIDWLNVQLTAQNQCCSWIFNGGKALSQGTELSVNFLPWTGMTWAATMAYIDAHLTNNAEQGFQGVRGNDLPGNSRISASFTVRQDFRISGSVTGFAGGTAVYVGRRFQGYPPIPDAPQPVAPGYASGDLRAGISTGGFTVTGFVKNVSNAAGILTLAEVTPTLFGATIIQPRTVGISVAKSF